MRLRGSAGGLLAGWTAAQLTVYMTAVRLYRTACAGGHSSESGGTCHARDFRANFISDSGLRSEAGWLERRGGALSGQGGSSSSEVSGESKDRVLEVMELRKSGKGDDEIYNREKVSGLVEH